jgi:hypothetical protein
LVNRIHDRLDLPLEKLGKIGRLRKRGTTYSVWVSATFRYAGPACAGCWCTAPG